MTVVLPCGEFLRSRVLEVKSFGDGHINDTYYVNTEEGEFVCQRLRREMNPDDLERNYLLYSKVFEREGLEYPVWLKPLYGGESCGNGSFFYMDQEGNHWRMYPMIQGEILTAPLSSEELYACGYGLARMHGVLQELSEKPKAVYPMLHDLEYYYKTFCEVKNDKEICGENWDGDLEELIDSQIENLLDLPLDRTRVVHGDPKLANVLFQEGKVKAFLDLDTVMIGSILEDIADCIRSACIMDGRIDMEAARILFEGYLSADTDLLSEGEKKLLPAALGKICFELGLRYYTDAISKHKVFKVKSPGYSLEKAKRYFGLFTNLMRI